KIVCSPIFGSIHRKDFRPSMPLTFLFAIAGPIRRVRWSFGKLDWSALPRTRPLVFGIGLHSNLSAKSWRDHTQHDIASLCMRQGLCLVFPRSFAEFPFHS